MLAGTYEYAFNLVADGGASATSSTISVNLIVCTLTEPAGLVTDFSSEIRPSVLTETFLAFTSNDAIACPVNYAFEVTTASVTNEVQVGVTSLCGTCTGKLCSGTTSGCR